MARQGLLDATALTPPGQGGPPPAAPPTGLLPAPDSVAAPPGDQVPASAAEQADYDQFVKNAHKALYADVPTLLRSLSADGDPVTGLAQTVSGVVSRLVDSAKKDGKALSDEVILNAGIEIMEDLADFAAEAKIHDFTPEELESAAYLAAEMYRGSQQGKGQHDPNAAAAELENLQQASESGALEKLAPGATERFAGFETGAPVQNVAAAAPPSPSQGLVR
tara:strand:+ start:64 stop:726 length:663 start_codon:yes stop_codon:yes gene_type:complete